MKRYALARPGAVRQQETVTRLRLVRMEQIAELDRDAPADPAARPAAPGPTPGTGATSPPAA